MIENQSAKPIVASLTAVSPATDRVQLFGLDEDGEVLLVSWNGERWHWSEPAKASGSNGFNGQITATSMRDGSVNVFGMAKMAT